MPEGNQQSSSKSSNSEETKVSTGKWSAKEHELFVEGHKLYRYDWEMICHHVGTRTVAQVRSHAQKFFNKQDYDEHKIGAQKIQVRGENDRAMTRSKIKMMEEKPKQEQQVPIIPQPIRPSSNLKVLNKNRRKKMVQELRYDSEMQDESSEKLEVIAQEIMVTEQAMGIEYMEDIKIDEEKGNETIETGHEYPDKMEEEVQMKAIQIPVASRNPQSPQSIRSSPSVSETYSFYSYYMSRIWERAHGYANINNINIIKMCEVTQMTKRGDSQEERKGSKSMK